MPWNDRLWAVFWVSCALIVAGLLPRAWKLHLLYTDTTLRVQTRAALEAVTQREEWLLSDVLLQDVWASGLRVVHRQHTRGTDPETCYNIMFANPQFLLPCDP